MTCRGCGCTDGRACVTTRGAMTIVCWWERPGLCSFCALGVTVTERDPIDLPLVDDVLTGGLL